MHTPVVEPHSGLANLTDPLLQACLTVSASFVVIGSRGEPDHFASPPIRHLPIRLYLIDQSRLLGRPQSFCLMTSCSICFLSERSATILFTRSFSCSSSVSRFISNGIGPAYLFFPLKNAVELMSAFRQSSANGAPSPAWLMMNAFCAYVRFDAFVRFRSSPSRGFQCGEL